MWSRICKLLSPAHRYGQFKFKIAILSWTLYAWNDNEFYCTPSHEPGSAFILHPICLEWFWINCTPPTDPVQHLFCTLYICLEWFWILIAPPPPTDPVQLLFCILYAWNDDELIAPFPRTRFSFYFAPYMLGMMMKFRINCTPSHGPGSAFILHPICLEWWWNSELIAPPPTDPVQLLFCTLYAWNDDEFRINCTLCYGPGSAFILHPICLEWWWNSELIAPPPTDPVQLLFCTLYAWNDDEIQN